MPDPSAMPGHSQGAVEPAYLDPVAGDPLPEILDQLTEGVATLTEAGVVVSWNPGVASLTGYTLTEINARGLLQIFDAPDVMMRLLQEAQRGSTVLGERLVLKRADGRRVPVDVHCSPLRHMGQTRGRVVVILRDLSDLESLQNRLLQSERLNILGRLAGALSHDIRNPLTAIFLHTDVLADELQQLDGSKYEPLRRSLAVIKDEVARLHDLVQQYLSLARLSDLQREVVDLRAYLEAFGAEMQQRLAVRDIELRLEGDSDIGPVALHQNSFRRVLLNLLNNAVEAMPHGGVLTLRGQRLAAHVRLEISDTGGGIPVEQQPLLFSPFHSTKPEGTGLGLYLVREIVSAHQGDITVTSAPGQGTTFTVTLPILTTTERRTTSPAERTKADGQHSGRG
jgi:two-component system sensor histidine kinase AtoS